LQGFDVNDSCFCVNSDRDCAKRFNSDVHVLCIDKSACVQLILNVVAVTGCNKTRF